MFKDVTVRTIQCDGPECTRSVTFDRIQEAQVIEAPENSWLKNLRVVQTADGRAFTYCNDECEVKGAANGRHNRPESGRIVEGNAAAVATAARAAQAAQSADAAVRSGRNIQIQG